VVAEEDHDAISVAQRFSSDLKLNLHWHLLLADGVWQERDRHVQFYPAEPLETIRVQQCWFAHLWCDPLNDAVLRITKALTRRGWQDRDDDPFAEQEPGLSALHPRCTNKTAPKVPRLLLHQSCCSDSPNLEPFRGI
jgi:hypothetical protein